MSAGHSHEPAGGPDDGGGFDWWRAADYAIWAAVGVVAIIGIEWLVGYVIREKISRGADRFLAGVTPPSE